jgi:uncharacterized protein (TIGR03437 family)
MFRILIGFICTSSFVVHAQPPAIGQNGVVNSASQIPPTLAGGALARGARFKIQGVRLAGSDPTSVILSRGAVSQNAQVLSAASLTIEAIVPPTAPLGPVEIRVRRGSETSAPFPVRISGANSGLYSRNGSGWGPGLVQNLRSNRRDNSIDDPARPSESVAILTTGAGGVTPEVFVGSKRAKVLRIEPSAEPGKEAIVVEIPGTAPEGCFVPVYAREREPDAAPSNTITVSIRRGTGGCRMPTEFPVPLFDSRTTGMIVISRASGLSQNGRGKWMDDDAVAAFVKRDASPPNAPLLLTPPVGTCTVYTGSSQSSFDMPLTISEGLSADLGGEGLDVGAALNLSNGQETRVVPSTPGAPGFYHAPLGTSESRRRPLFLNPASVALTAPGGRNSGPFDLTLQIAPPFTWTNREQIVEVDRHRPLTLTWTPATPNQVKLILAMNVDQLSTARAMCYCVASGGAGKFTIDPDFLANFPGSRDIPGEPLDQLMIAAPIVHMPAAVTGIGRLQAMTLFANVRIVRYR